VKIDRSVIKPGFCYNCWWLCAALLGVALAQGCSHKSEDQPASSAGAANPSTAPTATPAQSAANDQPRESIPAGNAQGALAESEAAIRAKEYEKAAQAMIAMQQAKLNEQQAQAVRSQMIQLQKDLASAISQGDPKAKAAADLLRRSASGSH